MRTDTDNGQRHTLVVTIDPVAVIVVRTGKSNHLPGRQIFVAAVNRIGKKASSRIR
jgi:hypothetical protein